MRKIYYPKAIDDLLIQIERSIRNGQIERQTGVTILDVCYVLLELEKKCGIHGSDEATSHDYRIRQIEEQLGIPAPEFTEVLSTPSGPSGQRQSGVATLTGTSLAFKLARPFLVPPDPGDMWVRGWTAEYNVDAWIACTDGENVTITAAEACDCEWSIKGEMAEVTYQREEQYSATVNYGSEITFPAFPAAKDYVIQVDSATKDDPEAPGTPIDIEIEFEKQTDRVVCKPAEDGTALTITIIGASQ